MGQTDDAERGVWRLSSDVSARSGGDPWWWGAGYVFLIYIRLSVLDV